MLEHMNKTYEDSFFHMMDEEIHDNFGINPFENVFNKNSVVLVHDNRYRSLDNRKIENTQNFFIDPCLFKQDIIDRQLEFAKTSMNNKTNEYENVQYDSISKNHKEFESENLEVVKEESSNISEINSKPIKKRGPRKCKYSRWGKEDDKMLLASIKNLIAQGRISKEFIENVTTSQSLEEESDLEEVKMAISWKNPILNLQKRIQKLFAVKELSIRERQKLRRLIKAFKDKPIDYEYLMAEFPGKSKSILEKACIDLKNNMLDNHN